MSIDVVEAAASHLNKSAACIFSEALGNIKEKRLAMFLSAYETENFVPDEVEKWCLVRLLGTTGSISGDET